MANRSSRALGDSLTEGRWFSRPRENGAAAKRGQYHPCVMHHATLLHPLVTSSVLAYTWDHRVYGAVRHLHLFFPYYNVTDARMHHFRPNVTQFVPWLTGLLVGARYTRLLLLA